MTKTILTWILTTILLTTSSSAQAQQPAKVPRIGILSIRPGPEPSREGAFQEVLRDLGYVEGQSIVIEYRYAKGKLDRFPDFAAELVRLKVDVIVAVSTPAIQAAKNATSTIPIVMAGVSDPVATGFVASLARPGGNIHGSVATVPGVERKTAGATQGNYSKTLTRSLPSPWERSRPPVVREGSAGRRPEL